MRRSWLMGVFFVIALCGCAAPKDLLSPCVDPSGSIPVNYLKQVEC